MKSNRFNFFVPATISKSRDSSGNEIMEVQGVASTIMRDLEGESLDPSGFEIDYFLKSGLLKWEHGKDPKSYIGTPTEARVTSNNEFFIKGRLWNDSETARSAYELAKTLEKSNSGRKIGWSIEGNSLEKSADGKNIPRARITNVVLTMNPVNTNTWAEIVKSNFKADYIEPEFEKKTNYQGEACIFSSIEGNQEISIDTDFNIVKKSIDPDIIKKDETKGVPKDFLSDLIKEHEKLIWLLKEGTKEEIEEELKIQQKELETYKKEYNSLGKTISTNSGAALVAEDVEGSPKVLAKSVSSDCIQKSVTILINAILEGILPKSEQEKIKKAIA